MIPFHRRVPPRGNPNGEHTTVPPNGAQAGATLSIRNMLIFAALTSGVGFLTVEGLRAIFGWYRGRRERTANAFVAEQARMSPPGRLDNGNFQLPLPDGTPPYQMSGPPHVGFARPQIVPDQSNPLGQLQHYMQQTDYRFQRMENLMAQMMRTPAPGQWSQPGGGQQAA